ncbi:MAG: type I DNA topoisomerase [Candidatus Omnitrophota bacterium]
MGINNLVIVESPAKAKTIEKFLGKDFIVKSSMGHIRDLVKKNFGIDKENNYQPQYEISADKKKIVTELKKYAQEAEIVWLASDEDREGEAISWHLAEVLKLKPERTRRIAFHEITKDAIMYAIANPRSIDQNLVDSQQARRILDRLVGFELSPILWRKVKPSLSAGRVQSVAVRLLVEREREIQNFKPTSTFRVTAIFTVTDKKGKTAQLKAELNRKLKSAKHALEFLNNCQDAAFTVTDIVTKPSKKSPAPPFTTSTLQQEASRKLGFSVSQTMVVAQKLYEAGKITYMRTDSVNLSDLAIGTAKAEIIDSYGDAYSRPRHYKTKSKGAQEAHEAIRPTYMNQHTITGTAQEKKLYELIWKRTVASQMSDAQLEKTTVNIAISTRPDDLFIARGEVLKFDGFLKVYIESTDLEIDADADDEEEGGRGLLPPLQVHDRLEAIGIEAMERYSQRPARYTEASLVKKLEELGIGRPSTYAPTISTIQQRGYVVKEDREGTPRSYQVLTLQAGKIQEETRSEITGAEKSKLFPTDIGMVVNDFLIKYFTDIMDYNFTATVEEEFDEIAEGKRIWYKMIDDFYQPFHLKVVETTEKSQRNTGERRLGVEPKTGKPVIVRIGKYGPMVQIGESPAAGSEETAETGEIEEKPKYAALAKGQRIETITLEEALQLFNMPRHLGPFEDHEVTVAIGRFGPYIKHQSAFFSLKKGVDDPFTIDLDRAIELIREKREADQKKTIKVFEQDPEMKILNGRWGPYISYKKENYKVPKTTDPASLSLDDCLKIIETAASKPRSTYFKKGKKKSAARK